MLLLWQLLLFSPILQEEADRWLVSWWSQNATVGSKHLVLTLLLRVSAAVKVQEKAEGNDKRVCSSLPIFTCRLAELCMRTRWAWPAQQRSSVNSAKSQHAEQRRSGNSSKFWQAQQKSSVNSARSPRALQRSSVKSAKFWHTHQRSNVKHLQQKVTQC